MKQFLFLLLVSLLLSNCATRHECLPSWESVEHNSSARNIPAISISPSQTNYDYFQDANGAIHQNESNPYLMNVDTSDSYYRMLRRSRNLLENKYTQRIREKLKSEELKLNNYEFRGTLRS